MWAPAARGRRPDSRGARSSATSTRAGSGSLTSSNASRVAGCWKRYGIQAEELEMRVHINATLAGHRPHHGDTGQPAARSISRARVHPDWQQLVGLMLLRGAPMYRRRDTHACRAAGGANGRQLILKATTSAGNGPSERYGWHAVRFRPVPALTRHRPVDALRSIVSSAQAKSTPLRRRVPPGQRHP